MKPREDGEGVAMNKTSMDLTYPNMTQDEPERVKVEEMARDYAKLCGWELTEPGWRRVHEDDLAKAFLAFANDIASRLSVSEKRAELAEHRLADNLGSGGKAFLEWLLRLQDRLAKAESERDSSQASLLRVVPVYDAAIAWCRCYLTEGGKSSESELREAIRTALSPHTEK